jgi:hypothetical protein
MKKGILFGIELFTFYLFLTLIGPYFLMKYRLNDYNWLKSNFLIIIVISLIVCYSILFYLIIIKKWEL